MSGIIKLEDLQDRIIEIRGQMVLLDSDVAELYDVETKRINEAVKNNPDKFPADYIVELEKKEWDLLKSKFSTSIKMKPQKVGDALFSSFPRRRESRNFNDLAKNWMSAFAGMTTFCEAINKGWESKTAKRLHRKRAVYARNDSEGAQSSSGYPVNHRDFRKNQTALKEYSGTVSRQGQG